jgi:large subunit ribosomal protein L22
MAEEEKPERRRRSKPPEDAPAAEASPAPEGDAEAAPADEVEPTPADVEAEEATEVVLEADDEAEGEADSEDEVDEAPAEEAAAEAPAPSRRRRRRGAAATEEAAEPTAPAPTRRRRRERDPNLPPPEVRAQAKYVRSSARKARLVCDHIRGKTVEEARAILAHTPRAVARDWSKLLESAVANAEHNHELVGEDLYVKAVHADEGPTLKRYRPRAMGRATGIRKRTSHLTILLTPKD